MAVPGRQCSEAIAAAPTTAGCVRRYPLISAATFGALRAAVEKKAQPSRCWAFAPPIPPATAGSVVEGDRLVAIREHADATLAERAITLCTPA